MIKNKILDTNNDESIKSTNILRYYGIGAQIIKDLKIKNMVLVSRSKKKIIGLDAYGIKITKQVIIKWKIFYKILEVPGAFEIPVVVARNIKKYDGFIAIGSIIKGKTPNFDFISSAITNGLIQISILYKKPVGNAVLTCLNKNQVKDRTIKGFEAVIAVCDVLNVK